MAKNRKYAGLSWTVEDVLTVAAEADLDWTHQQAEDWLADNQNRIRDRLCELGYQVIADLLPTHEEHDDGTTMSRIESHAAADRAESGAHHSDAGSPGSPADPSCAVD